MDNNKVFELTILEARKCESEADRNSPKVAAALVIDEKIVATAYRGELGEGDHAEYTLFEKKMKNKDIAGATLYTTLEPCTSRKTHKPCADWIIEKGISKVYIGMLDKNPKIYLEGVDKLKEAGIDIEYYPPHYRAELEQDNTRFLSQYVENTNIEGQSIMEYSNNNGNYKVGFEDYVFDLKFSRASSKSIYALSDNANVATVSHAEDVDEISDIADASIYDNTSRYRMIPVGGIVIFRNVRGWYCALKILEIQASTHGGKRDILIFDYIIQNGEDFRI